MDSIETRLRDAKLGSAIDDACATLPDGYTINIAIERNSGDVILIDDDGEECEFPSNRESLSESIRDAVAFATDEARRIEQTSQQSS